ncbi:MAG: hypothetical protein AAB365_03325 [Patescibacteria group bacterium]
MDKKPKKKTIQWAILYIVAGVVDIVQILITFTGVGVIISELLELITGPVLLGLLLLFRIPIFNKPTRLISLMAFALGDAVTGGIAPFWTFDVWYIYNDVKKEEAQIQAQQQQKSLLSNSIRSPRNVGGVRQPAGSSATAALRVNKGGVRPPSGGLVK